MKKSRGTVRISGSIRNKNFVFDSFIMEPDFNNTSKIKTIQFQKIPGYDLEEHHLEVRQLWDDVRMQVQHYFESRKN